MLERCCHHVRILSCFTCHLTHSELILREGSGNRVSWESSPPSALARNPSRWGSRRGRHSRSSSVLDHSDGLPSLHLLQVGGWGFLMPVSLSGLLSEDGSSKVTCHFNLDGLGNLAYLTRPPQCVATWGTSDEWPANMDLHLWLPDCLQLWLNLSILLSSRAAAANACQWASCAMARASSHDPSFKSLNGCTWHRPYPGLWPTGLAWRYQWGSASVSPLAGHVPTYARGAP